TTRTRAFRLKMTGSRRRKPGVRPPDPVIAFLLVVVIVLALVLMRTVGRRAATTVAQVQNLLQRNEARFRAMVRESNDIMAIVDGRGVLTYASPATERVLGLASGLLLGRDLLDVVHPDDRNTVRQQLTLLTRGQDGNRFEVRLRHADGGWRVLEAVATN